LDAVDAEIQSRKNFILVSALYFAPPPGERINANCDRVLRHALNAAGLWNNALAEAAPAIYHGEEDAIARFPVLGLWYSTLIDLTRQPEAGRLLEGGGNLVAPAGACFTACWLTPAGRLVAERLIAEHPDWSDKLTAANAARRRDLILASALFHARPPTDCIRTTSALVLYHAIRTAGVWYGRLEYGFGNDEKCDHHFPLLNFWYSTLIELTRDASEPNRLLTGEGNFDTPAGAHFTSCWLTPAGRSVAHKLITFHHRDWIEKLTAPERLWPPP
jgi:hypothetical protein